MEEISLGSGDGEPTVDYGSVAEDEERQRRQQALTFEDNEAADQHRRKRRKRANAADAVTFDNEEDVSRHQALILQLTRFGSSDRLPTDPMGPLGPCRGHRPALVAERALMGA